MICFLCTRVLIRIHIIYIYSYIYVCVYKIYTYIFVHRRLREHYYIRTKAIWKILYPVMRSNLLVAEVTARYHVLTTRNYKLNFFFLSTSINNALLMFHRTISFLHGSIFVRVVIKKIYTHILCTRV